MDEHNSLIDEALEFFYKSGDIISDDFIYRGGEPHVMMLDKYFDGVLVSMDEIVDKYKEMKSCQ